MLEFGHEGSIDFIRSGVKVICLRSKLFCHNMGSYKSAGLGAAAISNKNLF